jgi:Leucine-rich repeat (LRR) protein
MIQNYKDYIKEQHLDVDPFNEEDWDIDKLSLLLQIIRKQFGDKPHDEITVLNGSNEQLTSLEGIENLVNLKYFHCDNNQLTSLEGIENSVKLEILACWNNQLTSLEGIENLVNLEILNCSFNQLTSLEGIENLVNLKILSCHNNNFSEDYMNYLKNYCENNKITLCI